MDTKKLMSNIYKYEQELGNSENIFLGNLLKPEEVEFILNNTNAFLIGLISDQSVKAETAWSLPLKLSKRCGTFNLEEILRNYSMEEICELIRQKPSLHRYPTNIAKYVYYAMEKLVSQYGSIAQNIWIDSTAKDIIRKLEAFKGISHKKACLACLLLVRDLNLEISDKENIDIIYDIHIRRIFLRAGFCEKDTLKDVIEAARMLNPEFPGYLTSSFWAIGRKICRPSNPLCDRCPINEFCKKRISLGDKIHA